MGEIVKKLFTSPIAHSPVSFIQHHYQDSEYQHVKRLDAALGVYQSGPAQQAAAGRVTAEGQQNGK